MQPLKLCASFLSVLFFSISITWAQSSPIPMLEEAAQQIVDTLKQNKANLKANPQVIQQAVQRYLVPIVDVNGMSRSVLGSQVWSKASLNERQQFSQAFTQLIIRTYATPLAEYSDETVRFLPLRGSLATRFLRVNSLIIRSNGKNIPLSYSLVAQNGSWKIYDFSVEGVSLLQSFRSQFAQALQNSTMQDLIKQLQQHNKKAA